MFFLVVILSAIFIPSLILYFLILYLNIPLPQDKLFTASFLSSSKASHTSFSNVLLVTAHPDDEVMFFAPTLLQLKNIADCKVHLLCLSVGGFDGLGETRKKELLKAGELLGINRDRIEILDDSRFPDNPNLAWAPQHIAEVVEKHIIDHKIKTVLTFDERGVSGHLNHIAIRVGVGHLLKTSTKLADSENAFVGYALETVPLIRKYISVGDMMFSSPKMSYDQVPLRHTITDITVPKQLIFISNPYLIAQARNSMKAHHSQMVWFRHLYIFFSRYMVINNFKVINPISG